MDQNDISTEQWREYDYGNGIAYRVENPLTLYRKTDEKGDSHRVVDAAGVTHYPKRGWVGIRWFAPTEPVSF
jgi:hypothetical protein